MPFFSWQVVCLILQCGLERIDKYKLKELHPRWYKKLKKLHPASSHCDFNTVTDEKNYDFHFEGAGLLAIAPSAKARCPYEKRISFVTGIFSGKSIMLMGRLMWWYLYEKDAPLLFPCIVRILPLSSQNEIKFMNI